MQAEKLSTIHAASGKKWAAILGAIGVILAAIAPPIVSLVRGGPTVSASGNGVAIGGNVSVTSNAFMFIANAWVDGARTLAGMKPAPGPGPAPTQPVVPGQSLTAAAPPPSNAMTPEPGAVGRLATNASLMNEASWTIEPSRVTRIIKLQLRVEGVPEVDKLGLIDVTLFRDGKDVCSVSINSKNSPHNSTSAWGDAYCQDTLTEGKAFLYRARVKATAMRPIAVVLVSADAQKL